MTINTSRIPFVLLAILSLLGGFYTGLLRIGWEIPTTTAGAHHGAIMIGGFLGTLISLEKVIPLAKKIFYAIPVLSGVSIFLFLLGFPQAAVIALILASIGQVGMYITYLNRHVSLDISIMGIGSLCWLVGNVVLFSQWFYPLAFPWWMGFLLFTIVGERLELSKFLPVGKIQKGVLLFFLFLFVLGLLLPFHGMGKMISGFSIIAVAIWLLRYDIISISIRKQGLTRFMAIALLLGYIMLLFTGVLLVLPGDQQFSYDMVVHTFFIGFIFSMIFAHGPIILPGVLGNTHKPYHPILYIWLIFLHTSLILRFFGDIRINMEVRQFSGLLTLISILAYFISIVTLISRGNSKRQQVDS